MNISKSNTTSEIKAAFSQKFPGLKLEFFKEDHQVNEMSPKEDLIENNVLLSALNANLIEGEMLFQPNSTAILFEKELRNRFGLNAQVYRRSNEIWLQTSKTDHWLLSEQNRKGINSQK